MILVCGATTDQVTRFFCGCLRTYGFPYRLLDQVTYPAGFQISWRWKSGYVSGYIIGSDWRVNLEDISGVFARFSRKPDRMRPRNIAPELVATLYTECDASLSPLLECLSCPVADRWSAAVSNRSKPYQTLHLRRLGLRVPPTLITTDPTEARQFYEQCNGAVVYKPISAARSMVRRMTDEDLPRLELLRNGPCQFQAFIPGDDIREHTVGDRWFATRIRSAAVDYRWGESEGHSVTMEPATLPQQVASVCVKAAREFGLLLSGIDLRETSEGEYYCFEVNGFPGFDYYELRTRQPISAALAELLSQGTSP